MFFFTISQTASRDSGVTSVLPPNSTSSKHFVTASTALGSSRELLDLRFSPIYLGVSDLLACPASESSDASCE